MTTGKIEIYIVDSTMTALAALIPYFKYNFFMWGTVAYTLAHEKIESLGFVTHTYKSYNKHMQINQ